MQIYFDFGELARIWRKKSRKYFTYYNSMTVIGDNIKYLRFIKGLSQEQFGQAIGLTKSAISLYERGSEVPINTQHKIAGYFGYTIEQLRSPNFREEIGTVVIQGGTENNNIVNHGIIRAETIGDVVNKQACTIEAQKKEIEHLKTMIADKTEIINLQREQIKILQSKLSN